jgi:hypothetical protein
MGGAKGTIGEIATSVESFGFPPGAIDWAGSRRDHFAIEK